MPDYPFKCPSCLIEVEISKSIHEEVPQPVCQCGSTMGRIYGAVPAIFTGSGFYKTDKGMK